MAQLFEVFGLWYDLNQDLVNKWFDMVWFLLKYEFCKIMSEKLGFGAHRVKPGSIDSLSFIAERPKNTSLNNKLSKSIVKHKSIRFADWLETKKGEIMQLHNLKNVWKIWK